MLLVQQQYASFILVEIHLTVNVSIFGKTTLIQFHSAICTSDTMVMPVPVQKGSQVLVKNKFVTFYTDFGAQLLTTHNCT